MKFLTGKDYPWLCEKCKDAVDTSAIYLREGGADTDDPEAPLMFAADHNWLCSGRECCSGIDEEKQQKGG